MTEELVVGEDHDMKGRVQTELKIEQHSDGSVTIEGTRYTGRFFREFGCSFSEKVGQVLRIDKKENGMVTVTRLID